MTIEKARRFLVVSFILIFTIINYPIPEGEGEGSFEENSYKVNSMVEWNLTSPANITAAFRIEVAENGVSLGRYITAPRHLVNQVSYYTHYFSGGHRTVAYHGGSIFQVWRDHSGRGIYLKYSTNNGSSFSGSVLVDSSSTDYLQNPGILIDRERVHVFYYRYYSRIYYEKCVNISDAGNITTAPAMQVNVYYSSDPTTGYYDVTSDREYVYLVHTTSNHRLQLWRRAKSSTSWEKNPINLTGRRAALYCAMTSSVVGGIDYLVIAYTRYFQWGVSDGFVHIYTLRNHGTEAVYSRTAISATRNFRQLSIVSDGGYKVYLTAALSSQDDIYFTRSTNLGGGWSSPQVIVSNRGSPSQGYISFDQCIGRDAEGRLVVVYEHSSSNIYMVYSTDDGVTWTPEYRQVLVASGPAFDPCIATEGYVVDFLGGTNPYYLGQVSIFVPSVEGTFNTTTRVSLPLLRYDAIFVNATNPGEGRISLRVFNGDGGQMLMNWTQLNFSMKGWAGTLHYDASIPLSGISWAVNNPPEKVYFEFKIVCNNWTSRPSIRWVSLNFTAAYPYWDNFTDLTGISYYEGMDYTGSSFILKTGVLFAKIETELIQMEDRYPDYLMINVRNLSSSNYIKAEVRDGVYPYMPIPGFSRSECNGLTSGNGWKRVSWGTRAFGDLSPSYKRIKIVMYITSDQSLLPEISGLALVRNNPPQIRLITVNKTEVYRGSTLLINVHSTDYEDPPEDLEISCQMRNVDNETWAPAPISTETYSSPFWYLTLQFPFNISSGRYQIRVRATDSRGTESSWTYLGQEIKVLNNPPTKPKIEIEEDPVTILSDVHIRIKKPSKDPETPSDNIIYKFSLYRDGHYFDETWIHENEVVVIPRQELNKGQQWLVNARAYDGENYSEPEVLEFEVVDLPPQLKVENINIELQEDSSKTIDLKDVFFDPDDQTLTYYFTGNKNILLTIEDNILYLNPKENYHGEEDFVLTASDGELETSVSIFVRVLSVNDLPVLEVPPVITGWEGEWLQVQFNASDEADQEDVTVTTNITSAIEGLVNKVNFYALDNGFRILPNNNMVGEYTINVTAIDASGGEVSKTFRLIILNTNNPPENVFIKKPLDGEVFNEGSEIEFVGEAKDPDTIHGQVLTYTWYSNRTGTIGNGAVLRNVTLPPGYHRITLVVSDGEYQRNRSITIRVVKVPGGGGGGESGGTGLNSGGNETAKPGGIGGNIYILIIAIGLIVSALTAFILFRKKGKKVEEGGETSKKESAPGKEKRTEKPPTTPQKDQLKTVVRPPAKAPVIPPGIPPGMAKSPPTTPPMKYEEPEEDVGLQEIKYIRPKEE